VIAPPPATIVSALRPQLGAFLAKLRAVPEPPGMRVAFTSWWRSKQRNAQVGGAITSQHLLGLAVDVVPAGGSRSELLRRLRAAGLVALDEGDHVHVQAFRAGTIPATWFRSLAR
jgi:uncharacterized protein YcbK (DUF882 family)